MMTKRQKVKKTKDKETKTQIKRTPNMNYQILARTERLIDRKAER